MIDSLPQETPDAVNFAGTRSLLGLVIIDWSARVGRQTVEGFCSRLKGFVRNWVVSGRSVAPHLARLDLRPSESPQHP